MALTETNRHRLIQKDCIYDAFFRINEFLFLKKADNTQFKRFVVARPDATAILLYNRERDTFLFVKQLRAPAFEQEEDPYLLELPAGVLEPGEEPRQTIIREAREETGYTIDAPTFIKGFYASPGTFSEKIFTYYAEVTDNDKSHEGGGLDEEAEDLEILELDRREVFQKMENGLVMDAKSLVALYWFRLHFND